jgi:hypothetical protein
LRESESAGIFFTDRITEEGVSMYRIAILDKDKAYRERLILFLQEHHGESFEITVVENLDALDMEVTQCNALFFGDDVPVDDALFPEEVAVGYLTENDESSEQHINKYQSMEKIYKRMLRLCEEKNASIEEAEPQALPYQAETVTEGGETYRVYQIPEGQLDRLAVKMLAGNRIQGLPQTTYHDGRLKVRITGLESLYQYFSKNAAPRGKEKLLAFFSDLITTALSLEEYMLSMDRLLLNAGEIYVNAQTAQVFIPYIPVQSDEVKNAVQCLEEIKALCSVLLEAAEASLCEETALGNAEIEHTEFGNAEIEKAEFGNAEFGNAEFQNTTFERAEFEHTEYQVSDFQTTESQEDYGSTEEFDRLQTCAKESLELKEGTKNLKKEKIPYLVRKRTGERIAINRTLFKLGKDASYVDYCIKDNPAVSRNHADILRKKDGYYLVDKGSLNHTFVNGKKLALDEYRKLEDGCLVQLANEVFEFGLKG